MKRILFERILLFLFVLSWVDLPRIIYEKFSWDFMLAYHGKNLFPFLIPAVLLFIVYYYLRSDYSLRHRNDVYGFLTMLISRYTVVDIIFILLISYMIFINYLTAIIDQSDVNFRFILPLVSAHFFYFFYVRFSQVTLINNIHSYFSKYVVIAIFIVLIFQLMMFAGVVGGLTDAYTSEVEQKIVGFVRVDGKHIGISSYLAVILLYLMLFKITNLSIYYRLTLFLTLFLTLIINQTRGALLSALIILLGYMFYNLNSPNNKKYFIGIIFLVVIAWLLYAEYSDHRLFLFDSSANARWYLIEQTFDSFLESPLFGHGSFYVQNLRFGEGVDQQIVHSYYLRFLTSYGVIGFIGLLFYWKVMFVNKYSYKNLLGLSTVFLIATFEPYLIWATYIIAIFSRIDQKKPHVT